MSIVFKVCQNCLSRGNILRNHSLQSLNIYHVYGELSLSDKLNLTVCKLRLLHNLSAKTSNTKLSNIETSILSSKIAETIRHTFTKVLYSKTTSQGKTLSQTQTMRPSSETGSANMSQTRGISVSNRPEKSRDRFMGTSGNKKYMIVGLGNIDLPRTRHSVGHMLVDKIAADLGATWSRQRHLQAWIASTVIKDSLELWLVKSTQQMNVSGKSIGKTVHELRVPTENVYLCHDDLDKDTGKARIKEGGSARGHKGVKSVHDNLKTNALPRLLIGIGRPASQSEVADYVLKTFPLADREEIDTSIEAGMDILLKHIEKKMPEQ